MKATVSGNALKQAWGVGQVLGMKTMNFYPLQFVRVSPSSRNTITLTFFDYESKVDVRLNAEVEDGDYIGYFHWKDFHEVVRGIKTPKKPDTQIELLHTGYPFPESYVQNNAASFKLQHDLHDALDYPHNFWGNERGNEREYTGPRCIFRAGQLLSALKYTVKGADLFDVPRPILTGIRFEQIEQEEQKGKAYIIGTNGHVLHRTVVDATWEDVAEHILSEKVNNVMPRSMVDILLYLLKHTDKNTPVAVLPFIQQMERFKDDKVVKYPQLFWELRVGEVVITSKGYDTRFPDWKRIIDHDWDSEVYFQTSDLKSALNQVKPICKEQTMNTVILIPQNNEMSIVVKTHKGEKLSRQTIPASTRAESPYDSSFALNYKYLLDALPATPMTKMVFSAQTNVDKYNESGGGATPITVSAFPDNETGEWAIIMLVSYRK